MARGNRRGDIGLDDRDRERFVETLGEVVESSGWVLMDREAERVVSLVQEEMGLADWSTLKKGDWRKGLQCWDDLPDPFCFFPFVSS